VDPEAHVVMLSVDTVKANIVTATNRGAAGFLKKPFSKERLLAFVEKSPFIKGSKVVNG
jgi:DNA-binding NarL/FixJ family response regulator